MSAHLPDAPASSPLAYNEYPYGKGYSLYVLALLSVLYLFDFMDRMIVSSLFSDLNRDMGVTAAQFGALTGAVHIAIATLAFPVSLLIDRWSRKKTVAMMVIIWAFACLLCAFTGQFWQLLALRFIVGAGEAGYGPGSSTILQNFFPPNKQNSAIGIMQSFGPVGVVCGMIVGGFIAQRWGWRHAFGILVVPGTIAAILVLFLKEPARIAVTRVNQATGEEEAVPLSRIVKKIFQTPTLIYIYLGMAMMLIFSSCVGVWVPSFFRYTEGLGQQAAGVKGGGVMLATAVGAMLGGFIGDRLGAKKSGLPLVFSAVCMVFACAFFVFGFMFAPQTLRYYFMLAGGLFLNAPVGIAFTSIMHTSHQGIRATALGCLIVVQNIFGMAVGATVSGIAAQYSGEIFKTTEAYAALLLQSAEAANNAALAYGIQRAILMMSFSTLIAAVLFFLASRHFAEDCKGAECFD